MSLTSPRPRLPSPRCRHERQWSLTPHFLSRARARAFFLFPICETTKSIRLTRLAQRFFPPALPPLSATRFSFFRSFSTRLQGSTQGYALPMDDETRVGFCTPVSTHDKRHPCVNISGRVTGERLCSHGTHVACSQRAFTVRKRERGRDELNISGCFH